MGSLPNCRCKADRPTLHGTYLIPHRRRQNPHQDPDPEQGARYQAWFDNARLLLELITEIEARSRRTFEDAEGRPARTSR